MTGPEEPLPGKGKKNPSWRQTELSERSTT